MTKAKKIMADVTAMSLGSRWRVATRAVLLVIIGFGVQLSGEQVAAIGVAIETLILAVQETNSWWGSK